MFLILVFVLLLVVLSAFFYAGTLFAQGYIYTQPSPGLSWRAPAAAAVMALFFTIWSLIVTSSDAVPGNIPYDTIFRFSPKVSMFPEPATKLWAIRTNGTKTLYKRVTNDNLRSEYVDEKRRNYDSAGVIGFEIEYQGGTIRFEPGEANEAGYRVFQSPDGWVMQVFENGPTGEPAQSRWGRFLGNLCLNLLHGGLLFVCLWLLLQFRVADSLLFAVILWAFTTVVILPMLLDRAAAIAAASQNKSK